MERTARNMLGKRAHGRVAACGDTQSGRRSLPARSLLIVALALCLAVPAEAADTGGSRLYRYKDAEGRVEISNAIPADRVAGGYEVLSPSGQVVQIVAPELTPAQLEEKAARDREAEACKQNVARVMALYGSPEEIDAAAEQAQHALESRIATLETNREIERRRLEEHESEAAQRERTGRIILPDLIKSIDRSRAQIEAIEIEIAQRRDEQGTSRTKFVEERRLFETGECAPGALP